MFRFRPCFLVALTLSSACSLAGGDYVAGHVTGFVGTDGNYNFTFKQDQNIDHRPLIYDCTEFTVFVRYENVPWYAWLPSVRSSHPTRRQTIEAGSFLASAVRDSKAIAFGYMGNGLLSGKDKCAFISKGLLAENDAVLSFNGPV